MLVNILAPVVLSLVQYSILALISHYGCRTTQAAEEAPVIVGRLIQALDIDRNELFNFIALAKTRNLKLQNSIFVCNWNVIVTVRIFDSVSSQISFKRNSNLF